VQYFTCALATLAFTSLFSLHRSAASSSSCPEGRTRVLSFRAFLEFTALLSFSASPMYVNEQIADEYFESNKIKHSNNKMDEIYSFDNQILSNEDSPNLLLEIKK